MGLATDKLFFEILNADPELMEKVGGRLYNTVIGKPEVDEVNEPVPYVIIMFAGLRNNEGTKDDLYESETDTVEIEIEVTANDVEELTEIAHYIRKIIHREMAYIQRYANLRTSDGMILTDSQGHTLNVQRKLNDVFTAIPSDYRFSTSDKLYDPYKPCYFMTLKYSCDVANHLYDDYEQSN